MVATRTQVVGENGVALGGHQDVADAGVRILEEGGNAVDALVAAAFTACVVEPTSTGIGGYGHLAVWMAERQEFITFDSYVRAPGAVRPDMFEVDESLGPALYYGWPPVVGRRNQWGHLAAAVPGAVAGFCAAQELLGRLPLAQVLEPAIECAERGLPVTWDLVLVISSNLERIRTLPHTAELLLRNDKPPDPATSLGTPGDVIDQSDLAETLRRIAREGAAGFYTGAVAEAIEREVVSNGGILTAADLAAYRPKVMREKPMSYRHYRYVTAYDQVGYEALNILDQFDLAGFGPDSVEFRHLMAEALGHAFVDSMTHYGDPEHVKSPVNGLASREFGALRAAGLSLERVAPRPIQPADPWPYENEAEAPELIPTEPAYPGVAGTTQVATADREGNMTALCTSLTSGFGSLVLVPGTGVFLNNSMQNFDPRPGLPNSLSPGKMPIFAAPAIVAVEDGKAVFASSGSGGYRIEGGVLHAMVHALDLGMDAQDAIDAPRIHCQGEKTYVDARVPEEVRERLAALGHDLVVQDLVPGTNPFARVVAIKADPDSGALQGGTGPAWTTGGAAY
jgi:gamma-glutamyltranspeptidase/glutathione hydrolase